MGISKVSKVEGYATWIDKTWSSPSTFDTFDVPFRSSFAVFASFDSFD